MVIVKKEDLTDKDIEAIYYANLQIGDLEDYGLRGELARADGTKIFWVNSAMRWYIQPLKIHKGTEMRLDANEIFVPISVLRGHRIAEHLEISRLFELSLEAKKRLLVDPYKATMKWINKQREKQRLEEERERWK